MASSAATIRLEGQGFAKAEPAAAIPRLHIWNWADCSDTEALANWQNLAACASEPNPFFESWYLLPSLRALDPQGRVSLLVLEQAGRWLGMMPLSREPNYYNYPVPQLRSWVHANCFLGAPLVAAGQERAFWLALLEWADAHAGAALFLHLTHFPLSGPLHRALDEIVREQGRTAALVHREERALLQSDLAPDAYLEAAMSGKKRKELRRQHARLSEAGDLAFERRDDADGLTVWIDQFLNLEAAGWKGKAGSAIASAPETETLLRESLASAASHGKLERLTLTLNGSPIAMLANFICSPGSFSYKTAFDETYSRFSPGVLIQRENLALLEREGIAWCDSCAAADHPMIDHIWRERRLIGRISIAIGGGLRRAIFHQLARLELARSNRGRRPTGVQT